MKLDSATYTEILWELFELILFCFILFQLYWQLFWMPVSYLGHVMHTAYDDFIAVWSQTADKDKRLNETYRWTVSSQPHIYFFSL